MLKTDWLKINVMPELQICKSV